MNEFEALKRIRQETCAATYNPDFDKGECCDVIEKALLELQAIKETKPSKALECLEKIGSVPMFIDERTYKYKPLKKVIPDTYTTIKQALETKSKKELAFDVMKKYLGLKLENGELFAYTLNMGVVGIPQEEFGLLKEVLENENISKSYK